ncbi:MAG TPA: aminotransferase class I/II-fold pyridoxal phosphate-dependent enzyme [Gemmatimonadaceae bacterium]|nr:aminotransferase class I/II-fold pyridoxal phosphate-dependent enzyme [Gemmatimonadaceae bacterium]
MHAIAAVDAAALAATVERRVSTMAEGLVGSEILKIAGEIRAMRAQGAEICNLTVGDFDPNEFRIPRQLEEEIEAALRHGETNYPPSNGMPALRQAVRDHYERWLTLDYPLDSILITSGSRPGIFATYMTLVDPGDRVVYPVPSWNNNHYVHLSGAQGVPVPCGAGDDFLPTRDALADAVRGARLLALNSPLNPAGTCFDADALGGICDLVLEENARRSRRDRPLYVMYDQVYWMLTFGETRHVDPVTLRPEMAPYTIYIDGVSKAFAATGLRVGWIVGPEDLVRPMSSFLGHVGAWAPRAEQVATARWLSRPEDVAAYREELTGGLQLRLGRLHDGLMAMRDSGLPVEAIVPMGAIYLSARFALAGRRTPEGETLRTNEQIRQWMLHAAGLAAVPFQAFGAAEDDGWFRLSVGATSVEEIDRTLPRLRAAIEELK